MAAGVNAQAATIPLGMLRHGLFEDMGSSFLRLDGKTEYLRAAYPQFVAKATGMPWFLATTNPATFKLAKVPAGTATVASGFDSAMAGALIGSDKVTLLASNLPEHDHAYTDSVASSTAGKASLLSGVLPVLNGLTSADVAKRTGKTGSAAPTPIPIVPPGFTAHLFIFAGRPMK